MRAVIIGATAGVGRALAEILASRGAKLLLVASDKRDLDVISSHLALVYRVEVSALVANAVDMQNFSESIYQEVERFGVVDAIFLPIGVSSDRDKGDLELKDIESLFLVNSLAIIALITKLMPMLTKQSKARLVGFSSVAAVRGRKANIVYSAAKRSLESYFESLRHLLAGTGVIVQVYRLGYVATQQSFGKKLIFPVASPQQVAEVVLKNLDRDLGCVYFPRFWALVGWGVAILPWPIFKRLNF